MTTCVRDCGKAVLICLAVLAGIGFSAGAVRAEPVQIGASPQRLNGNLEVPGGGSVDGREVVLVVHGTLSHFGQETIAALQKNLKQQGRASLAINLSLGVDDRRGPRDCTVAHDYELAAAGREIGQWIEWLHARRARAVDLAGFSRGGAQVATLVPGLPGVRRVVLLAPLFATAQEEAEAYQRAFGHPLAPELEKARQNPHQRLTMDFLTCRQAPVRGATFLDSYTGTPAALAGKTGHPTLVVIAGRDEIVRDLARKLPPDVPTAAIDGSGHFFPDLYGEDAAEIIHEFLARGLAPAR